MRIKTATFHKSSSDIGECPTLSLPEFAFIGRSNVGKSSLINMITNNKKLAKVSGKPGKTLLINHYLINKKFYIIDLPGYGYAKISKVEKKKIDFLISNFIEQRKIQTLFILIDLRHELLEIDLNFIKYVNNLKLNFTIIFTKADKLSINSQKEKLKKYNDYLKREIKEDIELIISSSKSKKGEKEILKSIFTEI
mgnify:FL=1